MDTAERNIEIEVDYRTARSMILLSLERLEARQVALTKELSILSSITSEIRDHVEVILAYGETE